MAFFSLYRTLAAIEKYFSGYKPEHIYLGIQMGVGFAFAMLPLVINAVWRELKGGNTIWTVITLAVVSEPNMGGALGKGLLRAAGVLIGGAIGLFALELADLISKHDWDLSDPGGHGLGPTAIVCLSITGGLIAVHKQRFKKIEHFFFAMLFTVPVVVGSGIRDGEMSLKYCLWRVVNIEIGVAISTLVSVLVFPIRARWLIQRDTASLLIKIGDLGVWALHQVCVTPDADLNLPGATWTDTSMTYSDDGVEAKLRPLTEAVHRLQTELADLNELLVAADKEWCMFHTPRIFPTEQYRSLLRRCSTMLGLLQSMLYWLQSTVVNLALVQGHVGDVRELAVQLGGSMTALSWLVNPPKAFRKRAKQGKQSKRGKRCGGICGGGCGGWCGLRRRGRGRSSSIGGSDHSGSSNQSSVDGLGGGLAGTEALALGGKLLGEADGEDVPASVGPAAAAATSGDAGSKGQFEEVGSFSEGREPTALPLPLSRSLSGRGANSSGSGRHGAQTTVTLSTHSSTTRPAPLPGTQSPLASPQWSGQQQQEGRAPRLGGASSRGGSLPHLGGASSRSDLEAPAELQDDPFAELAAAQLASQAATVPAAQQAEQAPHVASARLPAWQSAAGALPAGAEVVPQNGHAAGSCGKGSSSSSGDQAAHAAAAGGGAKLLAAALAAPEAAGAAPNGKPARSSPSCSAAAGPSAALQQLEPGELALCKLRAMVDAAQRLAEVLALERAALGRKPQRAEHHQQAAAGLWGLSPPEGMPLHSAQGLQQAAAFDTLGMVVNTGVGLGRQLAAMFTALDPSRAKQLHDYFVVAVRELSGALEHQEVQETGESKHDEDGLAPKKDDWS
ncbi:hypothetical protein N2152v2_006361 [Parachlorella kessleri]